MGKQTHTIQDVEGLILERLNKLRDSNDKAEQKKLRSEILKLEKHFNDCNGKHINGKKFGYTKEVPPKVTKKELLDLIDSVEVDPNEIRFENDFDVYEDLSGVSVGKNRFEYVDKGW